MKELIKNISDLRNELCRVVEGLRDGSITPAEATEMSNAAGKIHGGLNIQLKAFDLQKKTDFDIAFLKETK
jgi:hypothetical protein